MSRMEYAVRFNEIHPGAAYINRTDSNVQEQVLQVKSEYPNHHLILRTMNDVNIEDYINSGFIEFRRTYEQDIETDDLIEFVSAYKYNDAFITFSLDDALIKKSYEVYQQTHKANPVKEMSLEEWKTHLIPDLDYDHSIVIKDKEMIVAYLLMYDAGDSSKDIGYIYYRDNESKEKLYSMLYMKLIRLKELSIKEISLEVDNTDRYAYDFFESILIHSDTYMRTLILSEQVEGITIKPIDMTQVVYLYEWSKDREFCISNDWPQEQSIQDISKWWSNVINTQSDSFQRQTIYYKNLMIGYYDIVHYDDNIIELGIAIGERKAREVGLGSLIFSKITQEISYRYPNKNIVGITRHSNLPAQRMMIKSGYVRQNDLRETKAGELTFSYVT